MQCSQVAQISVLIEANHAAENDGVNRFQTGSRNYAVSAHVQREVN